MEAIGFDDSSWYFITYEWWFYSVWLFSCVGASFIIGPILKIKALSKLMSHLSPNKVPGLVLCTLGTMILGSLAIALIVVIVLEFSVSNFPTHFTYHVGIYLFTSLSFTAALLLGITGYRGLRSRFSRNTVQPPSHTAAENVTSDNVRQALEADGIDLSEENANLEMADFAPSFHGGDHNDEQASFAYAQANYEVPLDNNESTSGVQVYSSFMYKPPEFDEEEPTSFAPEPDSNEQAYDPYNLGDAYNPYNINNIDNNGYSGAVSYGFEATTTYRYVRCNKFCTPHPQTGQMEQAFLCSSCHDQLMSNCTTCGKSVSGDQTAIARTGHLCQRCIGDSNGCCTRCNEKLTQDRHPVQLCSDCSRYGLDTACVKKIQ